MNITDRILQYLESERITKYKFYKETGLSNGFLDKNSNIGSDKCEIICSHYPNLNIEWLILGTGAMLRGKLSGSKGTSSEDSDSENQKVRDLEELIASKDEIISTQKKLIESLERELHKWECSTPLEHRKRNAG